MDIAIQLDRWMHALLSPRRAGENSWLTARQLTFSVAIGGALYGVSMGAYSVVTGGSGWQMVFSGLKVPLFLGSVALICLPAIYLLYTLSGMADDFKTAVKALLCGLAALATFLGALAPFTLVTYFSGISYRGALVWNVAVFALATLCSQRLVKADLRALIARNGRHLMLLRAGIALFMFVGIQLAWNLRPFVGAPQASASFLRADAWSNAYLGVWRVLAG